MKRIVIAGGVSANRRLRAELEKLAKKVGGEVYYPRTEFCTDNGAMIAYAGMQRLKNGECQTCRGSAPTLANRPTDANRVSKLC